MKKDPYKFTVRFNPNDPRQKQAAELLNQYPQRGKAILITNALLCEQSVENGESQREGVFESFDKEVDNEMSEAIGAAMDIFTNR